MGFQSHPLIPFGGWPFRQCRDPLVTVFQHIKLRPASASEAYRIRLAYLFAGPMHPAISAALWSAEEGEHAQGEHETAGKRRVRRP